MFRMTLVQKEEMVTEMKVPQRPTAVSRRYDCNASLLGPGLQPEPIFRMIGVSSTPSRSECHSTISPRPVHPHPHLIPPCSEAYNQQERCSGYVVLVSACGLAEQGSYRRPSRGDAICPSTNINLSNCSTRYVFFIQDIANKTLAECASMASLRHELYPRSPLPRQNNSPKISVGHVAVSRTKFAICTDRCDTVTRQV